ncbi:glycosyltransferase [Bacillus sp. J33]|uniref:glycosyltransferase n=1 Tax=Bacillus sp. J33 TaxID=935836 RepID=UPI00047A4590|nr:glycosyltransferase [Bacillus sp. J33]
MFNESFSFKGNEYLNFLPNTNGVADNFSYQFIVLANPQKVLSNNKSSYLIAPASAEGDSAGVGIIMNGPEIRIVEYNQHKYNTVILVHSETSVWVNLVLVYTDKKPFLYLNGKLVATGKKSMFKHVIPSGFLGGNEKGECFTGKVHSIKLWKKSLTLEQVGHLLDRNIVMPSTIVWSKNFHNGITYKDGLLLEPKVTVIMPTYNKYSEILMTLHSLECQRFSKKEFEVIIADDGSLDETFKIFNHHAFSFNIVYIRSNKNIGRPNMRNLGIKNANGKVLIFLDSEILVKPDFIDKHFKAHTERDQVVVCGSMVLHGVFTKYHPKYNDDQLRQLQILIKKNPAMMVNLPNILRNKKPVNLLTKKHIYDQSFMKYSFEKPFVQIYRDTLFNLYGNELKEFNFPWILFCTGNVSVKAKGIKEVGLFEEYPGYGWDDHEMGYRLYKKGYTFLNHTGLTAYHQEHPIAKSNPLDASRNFVRMFNKYPEIQMRIFALHYMGITFRQLNIVYYSYLKFSLAYPDDYTGVKNIFYKILEQIAQKLWDGDRLVNLSNGFSKEEIQAIKKQLQVLSNHPEYSPFASYLNYLLDL